MEPDEETNDAELLAKLRMMREHFGNDPKLVGPIDKTIGALEQIEDPESDAGHGVATES